MRVCHCYCRPCTHKVQCYEHPSALLKPCCRAHSREHRALETIQTSLRQERNESMKLLVPAALYYFQNNVLVFA